MEFKVVRNDIVYMDVDAVVLPANPELKEGNGTSNAIFEKAGRRKLKDACYETCKKNGKIPVGRAIATLGYGLGAKFIIHAVVPKYIDGKRFEYELLSAAYLSALELADRMDCKSIAFPLLASGHNRFDVSLAYKIAKESIESYAPKNMLEEVNLVVYSSDSMALMLKLGVDVIKEIDDRYVLSKDETYRNDWQELKHRAKKEVEKLYDENKEALIERAINWISDPEIYKRLLKTAGEITKIALKGDI